MQHFVFLCCHVLPLLIQAEPGYSENYPNGTPFESESCCKLKASIAQLSRHPLSSCEADRQILLFILHLLLN